MKKAFICLLTCTLFLAACNREALHPSFKSENTFEDGGMQPMPNFAQFKDIPVPEKATMDLKKTLLFGNEPPIGKLTFSAPYSQVNLFDFYMQEMSKFGWQEITTIRTENSSLIFSKDDRIASIRLTSTAVTGTEVVFTISFTKSN